MRKFKFLERNSTRNIKYIHYTGRNYKKRIAIINFIDYRLTYNESIEYCGSMNTFLENYNEGLIEVEFLYYLKRRKKWDGHDERTITYETRELPRIGINDYIRVRFKSR